MGQIDSIAPGSLCMSSGTNLGSATNQYMLYKPLDFCVDGFGNSYTAGYRQGPNILGNHTFEMHLTKFDSAGNIIWQKIHSATSYSTNDNYRSTFITAVEADSNKNVYISGSCATEKLILDTITLTFGNNNQRGFVAKLDSTGTFVWVVVFVTSGLYMAVTDLELSDNRLYASVYAGGVMRLPGGQSLNMGPNPNITELTTNGEYIRRYSYKVTQLNPSFAFFNADPTWSGFYTQIQVSPRLKLSPSGNIAVVGRYEYDVIFGNDTVNIPNSIGMTNTFCALLDTNSGWINAYNICYTQKDYDANIYRRIERMPVFTVDGEDNIYYADSWQKIWTSPNGDHDTLFFPDGTPIEGTTPSASVIMSYDPFGQILWSSIHSDISWSTLEIGGAGFYAYGTYSDTLLIRSASSIDSVLYPSINGVQNLVVASSDLNGMFIWVTAYGGTNMDFSYHLRKSPCSDNFITLGLQSSVAIEYNQYDTVTVPLADRIHIIKHSPTSACFDLPCWHVTPPIPMNLLESHGSAWQIYPNPSSGCFYISNEAAHANYIIYTITGQVVRSYSLPSSSTTLIDLSMQAPGIYFVRIFDGETLFVQKILKE